MYKRHKICLNIHDIFVCNIQCTYKNQRDVIRQGEAVSSNNEEVFYIIFKLQKESSPEQFLCAKPITSVHLVLTKVCVEKAEHQH